MNCCSGQGEEARLGQWPQTQRIGRCSCWRSASRWRRGGRGGGRVNRPCSALTDRPLVFVILFRAKEVNDMNPCV